MYRYIILIDFLTAKLNSFKGYEDNMRDYKQALFLF